MKATPIKIFIAAFILNILFWGGAFAVWQFAQNWSSEKSAEIPFDMAYNKISNGEVQELTQHPTRFDFIDKNGNKFHAKVPAEAVTFKNAMLTKAIEKGVSVKSERGTDGLLWSFLLGWLPVLFFAVFSMLVFILLLQLIIKNFRAMK